jgi:hypothetical protein
MRGARTVTTAPADNGHADEHSHISIANYRIATSSSTRATFQDAARDYPPGRHRRGSAQHSQQ